jgi:hypothetical protein
MNLPKYLTPDSPQKKGRKQEKKACQTINSGALYFDPRDLFVTTSNEDYLVDTKKITLQKSFQFSLKDIEKFYKQSGKKTPAYLIYIGDYVVKCIIQKLPKKNP